MSNPSAACKRLIQAAVPLSVRKRAAVALQRQSWIGPRRQWWSVELIRDLAERDIDAFHEFLWTHHLGYAETYEAAGRFGRENIRASRHLFFADLKAEAERSGLFDGHGVRSVFEVGCSLGYQLRFIETDVFPEATELAGIDIDRRAIESGAAYLKSIHSRVALQCADTRDLERLLTGKTYDLIICAGVLMYVNEQAATEAVGSMLRHGTLVALAGLAHPSTDNISLERSDMRPSDQTFIHNFDRMVTSAGGRVLWRKWEGSRDVDGNTIYFVFARA